MKLQTAKIVSLPGKGCWSQVYIENNFLAVINLRDELEASIKAREIISQLDQYYLETTDGILNRLKTCLQKIKNENSDLNFSLIVGLVVDDIFYSGIINQGKVVLLREEKLVTILQGNNDLVTCSGFLKKGDCFILGTENFFQFFSADVLKTNLLKEQPEEAAEIFSSLLQKEEKKGLAAAIMAVGGKKNKWSWLKNLKSLFRAPRRRETKEQKMMVSVACLLAILLLVSVVFGWQKRRKEEAKKKFNQIWSEIDYKYQQGRDLKEINPVLSRKLLSESLDLARKNQNYKQIKSLIPEIQKELRKATKKYELSEVPTFLDLTLIKKDLKGIDFDLWQDKIGVVGQDGTLVEIDFHKKAVIKGKVEGGRLITLWGDKIFVFNEKIREINSQEEGEKKGEAIDLESFASNVYLLSKEGLFKYPVLSATQSGKIRFGTPQNWFGKGVKPDLNQVKGFAIDGNIWILNSEGKIMKFSRGAPQNFTITGLEKELNQPAALYTDEDCEKLYLLDQNNQRIVVLNKNGEYDSQYLWPQLKEATNLIVSEKKRKILLLSGEKIYAIDIE